MKQILYLLAAWLCCAGLAHAQDFKPGQQAQSMTESKNVTVDYATGTFHYRVPLYTLKSGTYELPVTLDYTARGVRSDDASGSVGRNWSLNTGGVVTRTVRGGIPDERSGRGFIHAERAGALHDMEQFAKDVDARVWDGESDIFTAVFGGQHVDFTICYDSVNHRIGVLPLEDTFVRIEAEGTIGDIRGWTVTDELGNRYIYTITEYVDDVRNDGPVSFDGAYLGSHVSSWYLSRIEPVNERPLLFHYGDRQDYTIRNYSWTHYVYGNPLTEMPFDFEKYQSLFDYYLGLAKAEMQNSVFLVNIPTYLNDLDNDVQQMRKYVGNIRVPQWTDTLFYAEHTFQMMGMLSGYGPLTDSWAQAYANLDRIIDYYEQYNSKELPNGYLLRSYLRSAQGELERCVKEQRLVYSKITNEGSSQQVHTPLLRSIECGTQEVTFAYSWNGYLESVTRLDSLKRPVSSIGVSGGLSRLSFRDKDGEEVSHMSFDYYASRQASGHDLWGYPKQVKDTVDRFSIRIDPICVKDGTLRSIRLADGGRISLDYEPNGPAKNGLRGGIRLKELVVADGLRSDTIRYRYPGLAVMLYDRMEHTADIQCKESFDHVTRSRVSLKGCPPAKSGNNGLYYTFVLEELPGRGTNAYWFEVVPGRDEYRKNGLLLGKASYAADGHLLQLTCHDYHHPQTPEPFFPKGFREQVEADAYRMDEEALERFYRNQKETIFPGRLGTYSPYRDYYLPNVQRHIPIGKNSGESYRFAYGGKSVVCRTREYHFTDVVVDAPSESDLQTYATGTPYCTTCYYYDKPDDLLLPTRVVRTDSHGDTIRTETRYLGEGFADKPDRRDCRNNYRYYPLEQWVYVADSLVERTHNLYLLPGTSEDEFILPFLANHYVGKADEPAWADQNIYLPWDGAYRLVESASGGKCESVVYDIVGERVVMRARSRHHDEVAALDRRGRVEALRDSMAHLRPYPMTDKDTLCLERIPADGKLLLAVLPNPFWADSIQTPFHTSYVVEHAGGSSTGVIDYRPADKEGLHWMELDLSVYDHPSRLTILCGPFVNYLAVVPHGTDFEAVSYNTDGTVYARFDSEGNAAFYGYDRAGRVIEVKDRDGRRVSAHRHHVKTTE